jgi:hypothetical protein
MRLILPQLADRCRRSGLQEGESNRFRRYSNMDGARMSTIRAPYGIFADRAVRVSSRDGW